MAKYRSRMKTAKQAVDGFGDNAVAMSHMFPGMTQRTAQRLIDGEVVLDCVGRDLIVPDEYVDTDPTPLAPLQPCTTAFVHKRREALLLTGAPRVKIDVMDNGEDPQDWARGDQVADAPMGFRYETMVAIMFPGLPGETEVFTTYSHTRPNVETHGLARSAVRSH